MTIPEYVAKYYSTFSYWTPTGTSAILMGKVPKTPVAEDSPGH